MLDILRPYLNPVQFMVLVTIGHALLRLKTTKLNVLVILILFISVVNEIFALSLMINGIRIGLLYTISCTAHHAAWIYALLAVGKSKWKTIIACAFIIGALINVMLIEGLSEFNYGTFILGAITYLVFFAILTYRRLNDETLSFFGSPEYALLFAPILFFFGYSCIFGFRSTELSGTELGCGLKLYDVIGFFINLIYYGMINIYIFKQRHVR